jgi:hypothetical protein
MMISNAAKMTRRDADRDGHRQPADQRQPPVPDEQAEPELDVEPRRAEPGQPALFAQHFERLAAAAGGGPGESRGVGRRVALPPELVFSEGKVSGKLALQVIVGPTATERAPDPACPLAKRGATSWASCRILEERVHDGHHLIPRLLLGGEPPASGGGDGVEARLAVVVGDTPLGFDRPCCSRRIRPGYSVPMFSVSAPDETCSSRAPMA